MLIRYAIVLWLAVGLARAGAAQAQVQARFSAEQVKAAFLYNFAGFVSWPAEASPQKAMVIGVLGDEEIETELRRNIAARSAPTRAVSVRGIDSVAEADGVHMLYIGPRHNARLGTLIAALRNRPILIVTDAEDGLERGGMINFVTSDRVQFEVSIPAAAQAGLQMSSRLLSVAARVRKGELPRGGRLYAGAMDMWPSTLFRAAIPATGSERARS